MTLFLEQLLRDPNATVTIVLPPTYGNTNTTPRVVRGINTGGGLSLSGSNTFSSMADNTTDYVPKWWQPVKKTANMYSSRNGGFITPDQQLLSIDATLKQWKSSGEFGFTVDMTFIATRSDKNADPKLKNNGQDINIISGTSNVIQPCLELMSMVYPVSSGITSNVIGEALSFVYIAPSGYTAIRATERSDGKPVAKGVCSVVLGKWFRADNLVIESVTPTFSKELQSNETPLSLTVSVTFKSYKLLNFSDIMKFFTNPRQAPYETNTIKEFDYNSQISKSTSKVTEGALNTVKSTVLNSVGFVNESITNIGNSLEVNSNKGILDLENKLKDNKKKIDNASNNSNVNVLTNTYNQGISDLQTSFDKNKTIIEQDFNQKFNALSKDDTSEHKKLQDFKTKKTSDLTNTLNQSKNQLTKQYNDLLKLRK